MRNKASRFSKPIETSSCFSLRRLFPDTYFGVDMPVQRDFRDLQCPANLCDRIIGIVIERLGNTALARSEGFWPAAYSASLWQQSVLLESVP
jgi:hypothetical protein